MLSRRTFIGWLGTLGSAIGIGRRMVAGETAQGGPPAQAATLDPQRLTRLGEAVLPGELGDVGIARVARGFSQWAAGYRAGTELVHPYGSTEIRHAGASPVPRWRSQLDALDRGARTAHGRDFASLPVAQRRALVTAALADDRGSRLADAQDARHVAVALLAWFYASPEATNLCYGARIDPNQCRPLAQSPREPLPLRDAGRGETVP